METKTNFVKTCFKLLHGGAVPTHTKITQLQLCKTQ